MNTFWWLQCLHAAHYVNVDWLTHPWGYEHARSAGMDGSQWPNI
jgi:hypothetical protein